MSKAIVEDNKLHFTIAEQNISPRELTSGKNAITHSTHSEKYDRIKTHSTFNVNQITFDWANECK